MIRVVIVDDERLVRSGLRMILGAAPDIDVVADCGGGQAVETVLAHRPDVVMLDLRMPDVDGLTVLNRLRAALGDAPMPVVTMLTTFDTEEHLTAALCAGAAGYLLKDTHPEQLAQAVRTLAAGGSTLDPGVARTVIDGFVASADAALAARRAVATLTAREREVLALLGGGLSNTAIAARLHLAPGTVKDHVSALLAKLGGVNRVQAAVVAERARLTAPDRT
ncbi:response regulator transcription factor [Saccharothrix sp. NPDC042600]|uniref:response regulator transcription factor n=1 Tax=Saccharothrix TaxID=2071 RepID=UPI0033FEDAB8|nr:response regulator transcription factor [Saccharothrix mutabilis subsp. capreolus]